VPRRARATGACRTAGNAGKIIVNSTSRAENPTMISRVAVASKFPPRMPIPAVAAILIDAGSRALSWLKKKGRSSVVTETSRCRRADNAASASGVCASIIWARRDDLSCWSGLSTTSKRRPAVCARSVANSSAVNGDFATTREPRFSVLARNKCFRGSLMPSARSAAAARLIRRPVSVMSFGLNQLDTVKTPLGVSAERKWCQPWTV
jgi:hypothetical protein